MKNIAVLIFLLSLSVTGYPQAIDQSILESIKSKAVASHSDAVIIQRDGTTIYEDYFEKEEIPIYIASAGKSLTGLAIGKLIDLRLLDSLDQPVHTIYPQWKQGRKKDITVRMLLNHTSGLQNHPNASVELEPAPNYKIQNIIELALAAELSNAPGEKVSYNNKAVALLGGIVQELSGKSFDRFFADEFFGPMDITDYDWIKDKSGNPTVHGAFVLKPSDFLKFGELMLNKGSYNGQQIISEEWVSASLEQSQDFTPIWGLLWWRLPEYEKRIIDDETWSSWKQAGVEEGFMDKLKPIKGKLFDTPDDFYRDLEKLLGENWGTVLDKNLPPEVASSKRVYGEQITAYYANGYRGNFLVILPEQKIVAVRCADHDGFNYETDFFPDFVRLVSQLEK